MQARTSPPPSQLVKINPSLFLISLSSISSKEEEGIFSSISLSYIRLHRLVENPACAYRFLVTASYL